MTTTLKIVGLGGSFRPGSSSGRTLEIALDFLHSRGHETVALQLAELRLPGYETCDRLEDYPESVHRMLEEIRSAHALIFATPVYHGTLSGGMKNALDFLEYLSDELGPLRGKIVGLISTSGGLLGMNAINTMDYVVRALNGWVCPTTVAIPNSQSQFDDDGNLKDERVLKRLHKMALELEFAATRFLHE